jgi:hypothetical protein
MGPLDLASRKSYIGNFGERGEYFRENRPAPGVTPAKTAPDNALSTKFRLQAKILLGRLRRFAILLDRESVGDFTD